MKRSGFTMIELVFIIVILGILGSIAVPKMAASREDARIVSLRTDLGTIMQALPAMAMSQGPNNVNSFGDALSLNSGNWVGVDFATTNDQTLQNATRIYSVIQKNETVASSADNACVVARLDVAPNTDNDTGIDSGVKYLEIDTRSDTLCQRIAPASTQRIPLTGKNVKFDIK